MAALGVSNQFIGQASAKKEGVIREATHKNPIGDGEEPHTTEPGTAGKPNIIGYYKVTLIPDSTLPEQAGKKITEPDKKVEQLIEGKRSGIGPSSAAAFPESVRNTESHIIYNGKRYRPHVIESGDVNRNTAEYMIENDNLPSNEVS